MHVSDLPLLNACLNGLSLILLLAGFGFIKAGRRDAHRRCMVGAFTSSCVFLVTYVIHKVLVRGVHTKIGASGAIASAYYGMLFTHIILAVVIVPMAITTIRRARAGDFERHRRIARITWPLWVYVSITGVLIYLMLYVWFPSVR